MLVTGLVVDSEPADSQHLLRAITGNVKLTPPGLDAAINLVRSIQLLSQDRLVGIHELPTAPLLGAGAAEELDIAESDGYYSERRRCR